MSSLKDIRCVFEISIGSRTCAFKMALREVLEFIID